MDANRFDALSRALTRQGSRRATLRTLLGGVLPGASRGTLAARHKSNATAASLVCRPAGTACKHGRQCCTGKCLRSGKCSCDASNPCPQPANPCKKAVCSSGRCIIRNNACQSGGKVCCDKTCANTQTDPDHCGTCGNPCLTGEACMDGKCLCAFGNVVCGGACVSGNCCKGDSGVTCTDVEKCCSPNGCINVQGDDFENCGDCGVVCDGDSADRCTNGTCSCGNEVCVGSEVCKVTGCECPDATPCQAICKEGKVKCGVECLDCPPPPKISLPGSDSDAGFCCATNIECSCGGTCCKDKDDCFQTTDRNTNRVVDEFCCADRGGVVCGNECCEGVSCDTGCFRMNPVGGSYRRPGR